MNLTGSLSANPLPLARSTKVVYGIGNVGVSGLLAVHAFFLLYFYTDVANIPAAVATTALGVAKIWDIINDPLFGWISDRTRSRWGRRRVYLVYGAVPVTLVTILLFAIPSGLTGITAFLVVLLTFMVFDTVITITVVPYSAMAAELTQDYDERTSLVTYSSLGAVVGFLLGGVATPLIASHGPDPKTGYVIVSVIFGTLAGGLLGLVAWRIKEPPRPVTTSEHLPLWPSIRATVTNKPFVRLLTAFGLVRLGFTAVSTALVYFVVHRLKQEDTYVSTVLGVMMVVVAVFVPLWRWVADRRSKTIAYQAGLTITAIALALIYFVPEQGTTAMLALAATVGFGIAAHWVIPWAMLPDVIEYDQLTTGQRREGMFYGVYGLIDKIARNLGVVAVGGVLALFGYEDGSKTVPSSAVLGMQVITGPVPAILLIAAVVLMFRYPVTRDSHRELRRQIALHHGSPD